MDRLRVSVALVIVIVWAFVVVYAAVRNPELTTLVTVITPVMIGVVGWLYADAVLRSKPRSGTGSTTRRQRKKEPPDDG